MRIDNTLHNRQPQPCAAGAARAVTAHKRLKQVLQLVRLNAGAVILYLKPGALQLAAAAHLNPAVAVARRVHHHIGRRALDGERIDIEHQLFRHDRVFNFPLIAAFRRHHFIEHRVKIGAFGLHLLAGAQIIDKLLDNRVALFDIFVDRLGQIAILFAHHLRRQTNAGQRRAQVVADARHQQRAIVRQLFHARRHLVKGARH